MIREVGAEEFERFGKEGVVLADFFSATCGPCKMLSFVLKDVEKTLGDQVKILKINFEEQKELTERYGVTGYPTLVFFRNGEEKKRLQGLQQKPVILKELETLLQEA